MTSVLYLTTSVDPLTEKVLAAAADDLRVEVSEDVSAIDRAAGFDALLIGDVRLGHRLASIDGPKIVQLTRGHHLDVDALALSKSGVPVFGASPALAPFVAEHALHLAADITSRKSAAGLSDLKLGIVGFGRVGQAVAERAKGLFKEVVFADVRTAQQSVAAHLGLRRSTLDLLLSTCDVISLHVQWGPTSDPLIGERELRLISEGAVLVNTADGRLIDEHALCAALDSGSIGGAALDVASNGSDSLTEGRNTIITPYVAGRGDRADDATAKLVVENILRALSDAEPQGRIEVIDYPRSGDPSFWSSEMAPRQ